MAQAKLSEWALERKLRRLVTTMQFYGARVPQCGPRALKRKQLYIALERRCALEILEAVESRYAN